MDKIALLSLTLALFFPQELTSWVLGKCLLQIVPFCCSEAASLAVSQRRRVPPLWASRSGFEEEMSHPDHWSLPSTHSGLLQNGKEGGHSGGLSPGRQYHFDLI